ncbi:hypothetical protein PoB_001499900 [Plakobranchus ocellatus]|uniref:Uncharacterized protein n=1 Tax=Plakobranchus ocellatus TaxID=259542 RepID=A0AAV3Z387_9GAST|nr:hypothetical protein PoB_001499900 [Plakobranchus ocellatus]
MCGLLNSLHSGDQPNSHVCYRFVTPIFAIAIGLALTAAHPEQDVRTDIKSQPAKEDTFISVGRSSSTSCCNRNSNMSGLCARLFHHCYWDWP